MMHDAMCEIIDRLIYYSGMSETEAICLVGKMLQQETPNCADLLESAERLDDDYSFRS